MSPVIGWVLNGDASSYTRAMDDFAYHLLGFTSPTGEILYAIFSSLDSRNIGVEYMTADQLENWKNECLLGYLSGDLRKYAHLYFEEFNPEKIFDKYRFLQFLANQSEHNYNVKIPESVWSELYKLYNQIYEEILRSKDAEYTIKCKQQGEIIRNSEDKIKVMMGIVS